MASVCFGAMCSPRLDACFEHRKLLESAGGTLADMTYFIVYLRDIADAPVLRRYMQIRFPNTPFLLTEARVCRPEWLIEVEGMAVGNQ